MSEKLMAFDRPRGRNRRATALFVVMLAMSPSLAMAQAPAATVTLPVGAQNRLGVVTKKLTGMRHSAEIDAFAKVLDPAPLADAELDLETAQATAAASRAEAIRSRTLHQVGNSIAAKDMEAAQAQARSDTLKIARVRQDIALAWGPGIARLSDRHRRALVSGLIKGRFALVHVDTHNNEGQAGASKVKIDVGTDSVAGVVLGPARAAEPRLQSSGLIAEVSGPDAILLTVGLTVSAHIEQATSQSGVIIPRSAIIRFRGAEWAYVRTSPTQFQRRLIQNPALEADGIFVAGGFSPGDDVVISGAANLFAGEFSQRARGD